MQHFKQIPFFCFDFLNFDVFGAFLLQICCAFTNFYLTFVAEIGGFCVAESIFFKDGVLQKCALHMYDRNVRLEYMINKNEAPTTCARKAKEMTDTESLVAEAMAQLSLGNDGDETYHPLYKAWRSYRSNPEQLKAIVDYGRYGMGLMIFLSYGTISDIDDRQQLASIAYLFVSKAIEQDRNNANLYKNRLVLMISNHEAFEYTVSSVVNEGKDFFSINLMPFQARNAMLKMEYADLSSNEALLSIDMFAAKYRDLQAKIKSGFFGVNETTSSIISSGQELHKKILTYIEEKVLNEGDIEF